MDCNVKSCEDINRIKFYNLTYDDIDFVNIVCKYCNSEQLSATEVLEGFYNSRYTLRNEKPINIELVKNIINDIDYFIKDVFNQNCIHYESNVKHHVNIF